ncbi:MAG: MBL fold metallo-hydrolase [Candidatus Marinimicrobia bacterium]|nr:MBL fold metallo-hydrolase [Candidatus Neomarinimicrobiota bacterium]
MIVEKLTMGPFMVNCYVVGEPVTMDAVIIDAGDDADRIITTVDSLGLKPICLANTHAHIDHVGAVKAVMERYKVGFHLHKAEKPVMLGLPLQGKYFGVKSSGTPKVTAMLEDGGTLKAGKIEMEIIHTPGHSPGGVCLYMPDESILFCGDTLFAGSIGRTDLPGGSYKKLIKSIREKLLILPDDTVVYTGHGPETTIGRERLSNPFLT